MTNVRNPVIPILFRLITASGALIINGQRTTGQFPEFVAIPIDYHTDEGEKHHRRQ
jgi:hypothetical protein